MKPTIILALPSADLTDLTAAHVYASDQDRESANRAAKQVSDPPVTLVKSLRPWAIADVHDKKHFFENVEEVPLDGGESFTSFQERVLKTVIPIIEDARNKNKSIVLVVDDLVAKLLDGWVRAGASNDGTVDIEAFEEESNPISMLVWNDNSWTQVTALRGEGQEKEIDMSTDPYAVLGAQVVGEMIGFDWQGLLSNLAQTGEGIHKSVEADKAKAKAERDARNALSKSIELDAVWASAETNLELASGPAKPATQISRDAAASDALRAGSLLDPDGLSQRCEAAKKALKEAAEAASLSPNDKIKQARMRAWQKVSSQCNIQAVSDGKGGTKLERRGSFADFFTQKHAGIPTWGWGLITVGALTALVLIFRSFKKKGR